MERVKIESLADYIASLPEGIRAITSPIDKEGLKERFTFVHERADSYREKGVSSSQAYDLAEWDYRGEKDISLDVLTTPIYIYNDRRKLT